MEKMTNVKALEMVLSIKEVMENTDLFDKITKMKVQFEKKNSSVGADGKKTLSAEQKKNIALKKRILGTLYGLSEAVQIKEFQKLEDYDTFSNQKLSALFTQLVKEGEVERIVDKKVTKFKAIIEEEIVVEEEEEIVEDTIEEVVEEVEVEEEIVENTTEEVVEE